MTIGAGIAAAGLSLSVALIVIWTMFLLLIRRDGR